MTSATYNIQEKILKEALADIPFDGLTWAVIVRASDKCGYDADVAESVFSNQVTGFLQFFSHWADQQMMLALKDVDSDAMKVRDRIRHAVWARLQVLEPYKEVVRLSLAHWMNPMKKPKAAKMIWQTSDVIWKWAGDTATDYNKYSKRGLLTGVISATTMAWLHDKSYNHEKTGAFLDRRIDNVLVLGKFAGKILSRKEKANA